MQGRTSIFFSSSHLLSASNSVKRASTHAVFALSSRSTPIFPSIIPLAYMCTYLDARHVRSEPVQVVPVHMDAMPYHEPKGQSAAPMRPAIACVRGKEGERLGGEGTECGVLVCVAVPGYLLIILCLVSSPRLSPIVASPSSLSVVLYLCIFHTHTVLFTRTVYLSNTPSLSLISLWRVGGSVG